MQELEDTARSLEDYAGGDYLARCWHNFVEWLAANGKPDTEGSLREWDQKENGSDILIRSENTYRTWKP